MNNHLILSLWLMLYGLAIVFGVLLVFSGVIILLNRIFPYKEGSEQ